MNGFYTYFTLMNPSDFQATVDVTYQLSPVNGTPQSPVLKTYTLPPNSRTTYYLGTELGGYQPGVAAEFHARDGARIVAERSMYWGQAFTEGSTVAGATSPALEWRLPEGSTTSGFETFVLLSNPNTAPARAMITAYSDVGVAASQSVTVPAKSRLTVWMNNQAPSAGPVFANIVSNAFSASVVSTGSTALPIVAEQAVYWNRLSGAGEYWRGGDATMGWPVIR
jgi:hypothetical protein